jgi:mRNA interferase MazF
MKRFNAGDVLIVTFPFSSPSSSGIGKRRPALVLADTGDDDVVVARITSSHAQTIYGGAVHDWQKAGLLIPSIVRADKFAVLDKSFVERKLGSLTPEDKSSIAILIREVLSDWI